MKSRVHSGVPPLTARRSLVVTDRNIVDSTMRDGTRGTGRLVSGRPSSGIPEYALECGSQLLRVEEMDSRDVPASVMDPNVGWLCSGEYQVEVALVWRDIEAVAGVAACLDVDGTAGQRTRTEPAVITGLGRRRSEFDLEDHRRDELADVACPSGAPSRLGDPRVQLVAGTQKLGELEQRLVHAVTVPPAEARRSVRPRASSGRLS
jgi:hypothetical protein